MSSPYNLRHRPGTCVLDCLHSVLCRLGLSPQGFSVISIQCLVLMTHHPDKSHLSLYSENLSLQEACLNGCGLEESLGAETWPLTHTELFPIWLRLAREPPTSPAPAAVFLAQTSDCRLWTPGCRITHSLILPLASARIQDEGFVFFLSHWSQSWIALPFPPRTRIRQESSLHLRDEGANTSSGSLPPEEDLVTWLPLAEIDQRCHGEEMHFL